MNRDPLSNAGSLAAGLDELFGTLTAAPVPDELAGERAAGAMFRANIRPAASHATASGRAPASTGRSVRHPFRGPVRWGVRLAAAGALALGGGMTAAAYAAVLPAPVQHLAHQVLGFAGVPDSQHQHPVSAAAGSRHGTASAGHRNASHGGHPKPARSTATPAAGQSAHASASPVPGSAPSLLSISASSSEIMAGSQVVISGSLTRSGTGVPGTTVWLLERPAGQAAWVIAGQELTTSGGNAAISISALTTNAVFRLAAAGGVHSGSLRVTVSPPITAALQTGSSGPGDVLTVSTEYARPGNVIVVQVEAADGSWSYLRERALNAAGTASFVLDGKKLQNRAVRAVLLATARHAASVSSPVTVPPPG